MTVENGATEEEVNETVRLARIARQACKAEIEGPSLTEQLEASVAVVGA